ncbi:MAG: O-antigen ligase family protein [Pirellulaceae bacterium]|nr:O-antigen ligase family protein [Pirellulaceae bacterium]
MTAWATTVGLLCLFWCVMAWRYGPQRAIGCQVLLACLVPSWSQWDVMEGVWLDGRMAATCFGLLAYCFHPRATYPVRLGVLDGVMLCLVAVHLASDIDNSGWSMVLPLRVYGEWCIPYIAGRLALQHREDMRFLAPWGLAVATILAVGSIFEGFSGMHPWEWIYGERKYDGIIRDQPRWGITRAWGCCAHPIYFGFLQLMFLPWLLRLWHRRRPVYFLWGLPLVGLIGVFCTGSRTPLVAYAGVILMGLFVFVPRSRWPLAVVTLLAGVLLFSMRDQITDLVTRWGETVNRRDVIVVDGKEEQTSGTMARWYLLKIYQRPMQQASWLGFGTERCSSWPLDVPVAPEYTQNVKKLLFVDNQYVLMILRFGWLGAAAFALALLLAALAWFDRSKSSLGSDVAVSIYIGITILAVSAGMVTVWMPHDIGFPLLWWMGAGSSYCTTRKSEK